MPRKCYVTGIGSVSGNNRPHSLKASRRTWKANLQKVRIKDEKGRVKRVYVSTRANVNGLGPATREILEYILDNDSPDLTSVDVAEAFGYSRQALKHHTDILKKEGIIEVEKWTRNNRLSKISLTQEGRMVAGWVKNFNRTDKKLAEIRENRLKNRGKIHG